MIEAGVIGYGQWGPNICASIDGNNQARLRVIVDGDASRRAEARRNHPGVGVYRRLEDCLDTETLDCLFVSVPASKHYSVVRRCIDRGIHVFVEKPCTNSLADAKDLASRASAANLILFVGYVFLYNPGLQAAKNLLVTGAIGKPLEFFSVRANLGPIRQDVGALYDLASHDVAIALWLFEGYPKAVTAQAGVWTNPGIEDAVSVVMTMGPQPPVRCVLHASWLHPRKVRTISLVGTKAMLVFDDVQESDKLQLVNQGVDEARTPYATSSGIETFRQTIRQGETLTISFPQQTPLNRQIETFFSCVQQHTKPFTDGEFACRVHQILELCKTSIALNGAPQELVDHA